MKRIVFIIVAILAVSCDTKTEFDAQGTFEATEVVISSEATGRILDFDIEEGMVIEAGQPLAQIDSVQLELQRSQLEAQLSTFNTNSNAEVIRAQIAALDDRISKCHVLSPISGTILVKYAQEGELATIGKPLVKVADLNNIYLRAYFTSDQLANIKLGDEVTVTADFGGEERYDYIGRVAWISAESEFTPKSIQTKDSRANLVYAVKIAVKNDGRLKIGFVGEVKL